MKHTPGPWHAAYNGDDVCVGTDDDTFVAMTLPCGADVATERDYANARLVAAAPDMLAVLLRVRDGSLRRGTELHAAIEAAIAKATQA
jgi:hypothetical protein